MAKYLLKVSYSAEGIKGVMKEGGTARAAAIEKIVAERRRIAGVVLLRVRHR